MSVKTKFVGTLFAVGVLTTALYVFPFNERDEDLDDRREVYYSGIWKPNIAANIEFGATAHEEHERIVGEPKFGRDRVVLAGDILSLTVKLDSPADDLFCSILINNRSNVGKVSNNNTKCVVKFIIA